MTSATVITHDGHILTWPATDECEHDTDRIDQTELGILHWYCAECGQHTGSMPLYEEMAR